MATILAGIDGSVEVDGSTMKVTSWSINPTQNLVDVTEIGDKWRVYFPTIKDVSGSLTFNLKSGEDSQHALLGQFLSTASKSTAIALELIYSTSADQITLNAFLSGFDSPGAIDGIYPITCNFQGTGGISKVPTSTST